MSRSHHLHFLIKIINLKLLIARTHNDGWLRHITIMKKIKPKKNQKQNFKAKKRMLKVLQAILRMEESTSNIANAIYPVLRALTIAEHRSLMEHKGNFRPVSNKKKMDEFRENWLDKQEVIQLMPVSERSLYSLRKEGKLPSYLFKGKIYFKLQDIEKLMGKKPAMAGQESHTFS